MRGIPATLLAPTLALSLAAATLADRPAGADGALYLTWNDCALDLGSAHNRNNPCIQNIGQQDLYCSFRLAAPADSVLGVEVVVDLQQSAATMPYWWAFAPGGCRSGALVASFDFTANSTCVDFFLGNATGVVLSYTVGQPRGQPNQARILAAGALLPAAGYASLDSVSTYYGAKLTITNANTVSPPLACDGCLSPACLVFNSIRVRRQPGALGGDVLLSTPGPGNANWATFQGAGANCAAVPVRAMTWGRIKSLYR